MSHKTQNTKRIEPGNNGLNMQGQSKRPWLGEIFRSNMGINPAHGAGSNTLHPALTRQFHRMRNLDPREKQQRALPICVYHELLHLAQISPLGCSPLDSIVAWLQTMAYFWCMQSCEYSDVQGERKTKILCVRNIRFFNKNGRDILANIDKLTEATTIFITFEFQKNGIRNDTISHQKSFDKINGGEMCPVRAATEIVKCIHSYNIPKDKILDTPINYIEVDQKGFMIPSSVILLKIYQAVYNLGHDHLGFSPDQMGTHSNRSGGAMGMFLAGTPVYAIMLMG